MVLKEIKKFWNFVWHDDSLLSWVLALVIAFVIVKFLVYPGLGLVLGTGYPVVAVVSGSMEHDENFESWWEEKKDWYEERGITKDEFGGFIFKNGFNKGDIIVLVGKEAKDINIGDVIVFQSSSEHPIIHRVVDKWDVNGEIHFKTKGDNNVGSYTQLRENDIDMGRVSGAAVLKVPYLGWVKLLPMEIIAR